MPVCVRLCVCLEEVATAACRCRYVRGCVCVWASCYASTTSRTLSTRSGKTRRGRRGKNHQHQQQHRGTHHDSKTKIKTERSTTRTREERSTHTYTHTDTHVHERECVRKVLANGEARDGKAEREPKERRRDPVGGTQEETHSTNNKPQRGKTHTKHRDRAQTTALGYTKSHTDTHTHTHTHTDSREKAARTVTAEQEEHEGNE